MNNDPVVGEAFFERAEVLELLNKRVRALKEGYRQNIAITGQRLSGKTSLLHQFLFLLRDDTILPIYLEITTEPFRDFVNRFIGTLLYNFLLRSNTEVREDLDYLIGAARQFIPRTIQEIEKIDELTNNEDFEDAYSRLLGLTSLIREETGKLCIVIFDEFHNLSGLDVKNLFRIFGKKIMVQKDTMYIVSSSQINALKQILAEKLSLLFGNFQTVELHGFDFVSSARFIRKKLEPIQINDDYCKYLASSCSGYPFHLDTIAKRLRELAMISNESEISRKLFVDSFESLLFESTGSLNQCYMSSIGYLLEDPVYASYGNILIAVARGNHSLRKINECIGRCKDISKQLNRLIELNIIFKNGSFYYFYDRLLGFWLRTVYQFRKSSFLSFSSDKSRKFREDVIKEFELAMAESSRPICERILSLCNMFDNETVQIDHKTRRLPKFLKTEIDQTEGRAPLIVAQTKGGCWLWQVIEREVDENDIAEFKKQCKFIRHKILRKVIVAPYGIDTNAKMLAKDAKIWLWDLAGLNCVLDVFCKPRAVFFEPRKKLEVANG